MTNDEATGTMIAGASLATAALQKLVALGHKDLIPELKQSALYAMERDLGESTTLKDKETCMAAGKRFIDAAIVAASLTPQ